MIPSLLCSLLTAPVFGQAPAAEEVVVFGRAPNNAPKPRLEPRVPKYQLDTKSYVFPTGLRILMQSDQTSPVIAITSVVDRGSAADPVGKEGIAHFVEHLWFRSEHGDLPKTWNVLAELGCMLNASTADDWTNYMTVCPSTSLEHLMRLESLRLTDTVANVAEEVVLPEREVIRNELRMRYENSWFMAMPYLFDRLYPDNHPYSRLGIGTHDSLNNISLGDIQAFAKEHYVPENTTITIVGDFDPTEAANLIFLNFDLKLLHPDLTEDHFRLYPKEGIVNPVKDNPAHWTLWPDDPDNPGKPLPVQAAPEKRVKGIAKEPPPPADTSVGLFEAPVEKPLAVVAWTVPGAYRGRDSLMNVTANMVGLFIRSGLWNEEGIVRESVGCFPWTSKVDSKILCVTEFTPGMDGARVTERMIDQVHQIWNPDMQAFQREQFQYASMQGLVSVLQSLDTVASLGGRATDISQHAHFTGSGMFHSDLMRDVMALQPFDSAQLAEKYLRRDRAARIVLTPLPEEKIVKDSSDAEYHGARREDDIVNQVIDAAKLTPRVIIDAAKPPDLSEIRDMKLANGLRVVVLPHGEVPVVQARLVIGGGSASEPLGLDMYAEIFSGESDFEPLRFAGNEFVGSTDAFRFESVMAPAGNLDGALYTLRKTVDSKRAKIDEKLRWHTSVEGNLKRSWNERAYFVDELREQHLNPGHPTAWSAGWDDYAAMRSLSSGDINGWLQRKYQPENATLVIVGRLDANDALKMANKAFGGWEPARNVEVGPLPLPPGPNQAGASRVVVFDDPKNTQTTVTLACPIVPATHDNRAARALLGDLLGERAWTILREQSGVTYGAGGSAYMVPGGSAFLFLNSLVQNDSAPLAVQTFRDLIEEIERGEIDGRHLSTLKYARAVKNPLGYQSVNQMTGALAGAVVDGRTWEDFESWGLHIARVGAGDLQSTIGDCASHALVTVEGPLGTVGPQLEAAGIAFEVFDWEAEGMKLLRQYDPKAAEKKAKAKAKSEEEEAAKKAEEPAPAPAPTPSE